MTDPKAGDVATCGLCGHAMPPGEQMFNYHGYSGPCPESPAAPAASEGEDWPTREMVKAGTLGGALTPNMACASFQAAWLARPAAQVAATPKHDEGRESALNAGQLADWLDAKYRRHGEDEDRQAAAMLRSLATQPAARRVTDGYYIATFKSKAHGGEVMWWQPDDRGYTPDLEQAGIYATPKRGYHDNEYTVPVPVAFIDTLRVRRVVDPGDTLNEALWSAAKLRAALESFAQPAEGVSGG